MGGILYKRAEKALGVPGVAFRVGSTEEATTAVKTAFDATANEIGVVINGDVGSPGYLPGPDSRYPQYGLWVPMPLAEPFEKGLGRRGYEIPIDVRD